MSRDEFDNYLKLVAKLLRCNSDQQQQLCDELRDHLELRKADLMAEGLGEQQAIGRALDEFGDVALMADNFRKISQLKRKRWMMKLTTVSIAIGFVACLLLMAMWPENARLGAPDRIVAQEQVEADEITNLFQSEIAIKEIEARGKAEAEAAKLAKEKLAKESPDQLQPITISLRYFAADEKIERALKQTVDFSYDDEQWDVIARDLFEGFGIGVLINASAADELRSDDVLSISLSQVSLETALNLLLAQKACSFFVKNGVMQVIRIEDVEDPEFLQTRIFNCRKLLERIDMQRSHLKTILVPDDRLQVDAGGMGGGMGGMGGGMFNFNAVAVLPAANQMGEAGMGGGAGGMGGMGGMGGGSDKYRYRKIATATELLIELVSDAVPNGFDNDAYQTITIVNGNMIVVGSRDLLNSIENFLQLLADSLSDND